MAQVEDYLGVLKASYDYAPQSDDEIQISEDQILLLIEKTDDDWWKVKIKGDSPDEEGAVGLVPSAYVEPAEHTSVVKAQYDYDASAPGELSIKEDQTLLAFGKEEEGWLLVQVEGDGKAGYVPANYVEESGATSASAPSPPAATVAQIVIPDSPPRPARPISTYTDPADLVASSKAKTSAGDPIQTWAIAEVDKKGKKKKGTLGIGNGNIFFASESDKTPVQKWQTGDIQSFRQDKPKHVLIDIGGAAPINLHFNAGSKDTAEEILIKLEASRSIARGSTDLEPEASSSALSPSSPDRSASPGKKGVHFAATEAIIPTADEEEDVAPPAHANGDAQDGDAAVALYDFDAQGEDELTVKEGEPLWIVEQDSEEWWKCRNVHGHEGVVPASYIEPTGPLRPKPAPAAVEDDDDNDDSAAHEAEERAAAAKVAQDAAAAEKRRKEKLEREQRAKAAAAAAEAEAEKKRKEREAREREKKQREREERAKEEAAAHASGKQKESRASVEKRGPPPAEMTRVWHDRSGQFRVEAAFLGYKNGMIRLHKVNGVVIEVPSEKMSVEDMRYVEKITDPRKASGGPKSHTTDEDDEPLASRRDSLKASPAKSQPQPQRSQTSPMPPKGPKIDWFEFFLNAGCDLDDCTRYASSFERDKIDETLLPDITDGTMRSLGLREGDIIRVQKAIELRHPKPAKGGADQSRKDEELLDGKASPGTHNLFTTPGGGLKNTRRGRPTKSTSVPALVDINAISNASEHIQRTTTPQASSPGVTSPVQAPPRTGSALAAASGFDDDAWTNRPSSTKPITPTPTAQPQRAPSAPPAPAPPPAPTPPAAPASVPPPAPPAPNHAPNLAKTTESDIFDQLARLSQLRVQSPAVTPQQTPPAPTPVLSPPPAGYHAGLGVGASPSPLGQHLQAQQTGFLPRPQSQNAPRGPLAPVPSNQSLLQPLIPTQTGFNGFVPTRPTSFQPQQQQQQQPSFLAAQPTGFQPQGFPSQGFQSQGFPSQGFQPTSSFIAPQPTGFANTGPLGPQPTGFNPSPLAPQPTGFNPGGGFGGQFNNNGFGHSASAPPVPSLPQNNFGQLQPQPTGFNPGFAPGTVPFNPQPPAGKDTTPANIFAQMKAGNFGDESAPQGAGAYYLFSGFLFLSFLREGTDVVLRRLSQTNTMPFALTPHH
ncbi:hypothetical protein OF83DRAFT_1288379 [Amylostereum chailletii]|nr:hypothetical protein OF83DRAFT_1288379 [Amylostereum chailletii]